MNKKYTKVLSLVLACTMLLGVLAACVSETPVATTEPAPTETEAPEPTETTEVTEATPTEMPLVVAYDQFSQKFSPFFADTAYDTDVASMTQISLLTTDRTGGIIFNAIEGETVPYNGVPYLYTGPADVSVDYDEATDTTKYTARLRDDLKFSDGVPVTADDIIFTYYTFLDPSYVGSTTLSSYDIVGLKDYQTQTTTEVFDKYSALFDEIYAAGPDHVWSDADAWTEEQHQDVWPKIIETIKAEIQGIYDEVWASYGTDEYTTEYFNGKTAQEIKDEGSDVAYAMAMWGFGQFVCPDEVAEGATPVPAEECQSALVFQGAGTGTTWDLVESFPTMDDYYTELMAAYENDVAAAFPYESVAGTDVLSNIKSAFIGYWGPLDETMGGEGVPNISGIKKLDDYTVEVTLNGFSAPAVYSILGINVTPLHYYGDVAKYDYENNKFGFDFGDLSKQQSLSATPMGAGPYKFVKYDNKVVYFEANENYYKGAPKIKEVQFRETSTAEVASGVMTGTVDMGTLTGSRERFDEVRSYNSNGELTGDVITTSLVDNLGYGYIGINAETVKVGDEPGSEASKNFRKGIATILAVHRDVAIDSYYGDSAVVINYPISNTSWAAPQPTDPDYKVAYSIGVDGEPIYTPEMTMEEKYAAAEQAALAYFEAAGFTVEDGKLTAAPEGAKLSYEVIIGGKGIGDHPAFAILTAARESLGKLGMELTINDPSDTNILWDALDAGTQELWVAAWRVTIDPDMYQVYHSNNIVGKEGSSESNHYHIQDPELDQLILDARKSADQNYRKALYKQALEIILDWAVEIPTYQRQDSVIFSTQRINIDTITPDITTYWGWMNDIELLEMR